MTTGYAHPLKGIIAVRRLSLRSISRAIHCDESHLSMVLNGRRPMTRHMAERLADHLELPVDEIRP